MFERIKMLMQARGIGPTTFCKNVGVSSGNFGDWSAGKSAPNVKTLIRIADYFNVSLDYLVGRYDQYATPSPDAFELVNIYEKLDREGKTIVMGTAYTQKQRVESLTVEE